MLTVAQSLFAVAALVNLRFVSHEGVLLVALFSAQLIVEEIRPEVMEIYIVLAAIPRVLNRKASIHAGRMELGLKTGN